MNYKAYDKLQIRKYWRGIDKVELLSKVALSLLVIGFFAYCIWYSQQIDTLYGVNSPLITL